MENEVKREIVTDVSVLRELSVNVLDDEIENILSDLWDSIPEHGLGLAAPQIGIKKRVFIAKLLDSNFSFVNPEIVYHDDYIEAPSKEGCLSLPGIETVVSRHYHVTIKAEKIFRNNVLFNANLELFGINSFIVQHEFDHLNGILMVDKKRYEFVDKKVSDRLLDRQNKINEKRNKKKLDEENLRRKKLKAFLDSRKNKNKKRKTNNKKIYLQEKFLLEKQGIVAKP